MANGDKKTIEGIEIEAVPMYNLKRGPSAGQLYHDKGRGNGYVLTLGGKRIYIAGDTEGVPEMRALKNIDVAFIPMNLPYTMPPAEAADAVKAFKPKIVYPYHYRGSDLKVFEDALKGSRASRSAFAIGTRSKLFGVSWGSSGVPARSALDKFQRDRLRFALADEHARREPDQLRERLRFLRVCDFAGG